MPSQPWLECDAKVEIADVSEADYYEQYESFMTSHRLKDFARSPYEFHLAEKSDEPREDKPQFKLGRACETLVLEGGASLHDQYAFSDGPINPKTDKPYGKTTKKYEDWLADQKADHGKEIMTLEDLFQIENMRDSVSSHDLASLLIENGETQVTLRGEMLDVACQSRLDFVCHDRQIIVDFKTCESLGHNHSDVFPCRFAKDVDFFGYKQQLAFYREMMRLATGVNYRAFLIAVQKAEPYTCGVFQLSSQTLEQAKSQNARSLQSYRYCCESNKWPTNFEHIFTL